MNQSQFINKVAPYAIEDMKRTNVLASITIAQAALESGCGKSAPNNNLFGIKGNGAAQTTKEFYDGQWVTIVDGFREYTSWYASIIDHSRFLIENGRYTKAGFFEKCKVKDYKGAARALQSAGYATDPNYAAKLISIIEANELYKYDEEVEEEYMIPKEHADQIISILGKYWNEMEGNKEVQEYTHLLANEVRKASGMPFD